MFGEESIRCRGPSRRREYQDLACFCPDIRQGRTNKTYKGKAGNQGDGWGGARFHVAAKVIWVFILSQQLVKKPLP